jgi:hypothetical protein
MIIRDIPLVGKAYQTILVEIFNRFDILFLNCGTRIDIGNNISITKQSYFISIKYLNRQNLKSYNIGVNLFNEYVVRCATLQVNGFGPTMTLSERYDTTKVNITPETSLILYNMMKETVEYIKKHMEKYPARKRQAIDVLK